MKWLIVAPASSDADLNKITAFLTERQAAYEICLIPESASVCDCRKAVYQNPETITQCIALNADKIAHNPQFLYLSGFFQGREIPFFLQGDFSDVFPFFISAVSVHKTLSLLLSVVAENFSLYIQKEQKYAAMEKLFSSGIPCNPDSFAEHVSRGHVDICDLLVTAGLDVNCTDAAGTPMLSIAARADCVDMIQWLVVKGANINAISKDRGYTAVMDSVWRKNYLITELLVNLGADLHVISRDGQPVLVLAVGNGDSKICALLFKHGADPNLKDHMGMSAYDYARLFKKTQLVEIFDEKK